MFTTKHQTYMKVALQQAQKAYNLGEVPVGCVIVKDEKIIAKSHNMSEKMNNNLMHAEIIAINNACRKTKSKFLHNCDIYITLEPCDLCMNAIILCRLKRIFFATKETKTKAKNSNIEIYGHILEKEASNLLTNFFQQLRFLDK
jgi:tRNA(adenine34) deaminase